MANRNRKVSHVVLALAMLASAQAVPFSFGMMGMGGLMKMPFGFTHGIGARHGASANAGNSAGTMPAPALAGMAQWFLLGWLVGCVVGWLVAWLVGWLVAWLVGLLVVDWLVD